MLGLPAGVSADEWQRRLVKRNPAKQAGGVMAAMR